MACSQPLVMQAGFSNTFNYNNVASAKDILENIEQIFSLILQALVLYVLFPRSSLNPWVESDVACLDIESEVGLSTAQITYLEITY